MYRKCHLINAIYPAQVQCTVTINYSFKSPKTGFPIFSPFKSLAHIVRRMDNPTNETFELHKGSALLILTTILHAVSHVPVSLTSNFTLVG